MAGDAPVRVAVVPGATLRRALEENQHSLESPAGPVPVTALTRGVEWLSVAIGTPPAQPRVEAVAQSPDAAAAAAARDAIVRLLANLKGKEIELPWATLPPLRDPAQ